MGETSMGRFTTELTELVLTCKEDFNNPNINAYLDSLCLNIQYIVSSDDKPVVAEVRPWNSIRVTLKMSNEAAQRLRLLAQQGDLNLANLGILSVQINNDQVILTSSDRESLASTSRPSSETVHNSSSAFQNSASHTKSAGVDTERDTGRRSAGNEYPFKANPENKLANDSMNQRSKWEEMYLSSRNEGLIGASRMPVNQNLSPWGRAVPGGFVRPQINAPLYSNTDLEFSERWKNSLVQQNVFNKLNAWQQHGRSATEVHSDNIQHLNSLTSSYTALQQTNEEVTPKKRKRVKKNKDLQNTVSINSSMPGVTGTPAYSLFHKRESENNEQEMPLAFSGRETRDNVLHPPPNPLLAIHSELQCNPFSHQQHHAALSSDNRFLCMTQASGRIQGRIEAPASFGSSDFNSVADGSASLSGCGVSESSQGSAPGGLLATDSASNSTREAVESMMSGLFDDDDEEEMMKLDFDILLSKNKSNALSPEASTSKSATTKSSFTPTSSELDNSAGLDKNTINGRIVESSNSSYSKALLQSKINMSKSDKMTNEQAYLNACLNAAYNRQRVPDSMQRQNVVQNRKEDVFSRVQLTKSKNAQKSNKYKIHQRNEISECDHTSKDDSMDASLEDMEIPDDLEGLHSSDLLDFNCTETNPGDSSSNNLVSKPVSSASDVFDEAEKSTVSSVGVGKQRRRKCAGIAADVGESNTESNTVDSVTLYSSSRVAATVDSVSSNIQTCFNSGTSAISLSQSSVDIFRICQSGLLSSSADSLAVYSQIRQNSGDGPIHINGQTKLEQSHFDSNHSTEYANTNNPIMDHKLFHSLGSQASALNSVSFASSHLGGSINPQSCVSSMAAVSGDSVTKAVSENSADEIFASQAKNFILSRQQNINDLNFVQKSLPASLCTASSIGYIQDSNHIKGNLKNFKYSSSASSCILKVSSSSPLNSSIIGSSMNSLPIISPTFPQQLSESVQRAMLGAVSDTTDDDYSRITVTPSSTITLKSSKGTPKQKMGTTKRKASCNIESQQPPAKRLSTANNITLVRSVNCNPLLTNNSTIVTALSSVPTLTVSSNLSADSNTRNLSVVESASKVEIKSSSPANTQINSVLNERHSECTKPDVSSKTVKNGKCSTNLSDEKSSSAVSDVGTTSNSDSVNINNLIKSEHLDKRLHSNGLLLTTKDSISSYTNHLPASAIQSGTSLCENPKQLSLKIKLNELSVDNLLNSAAGHHEALVNEGVSESTFVKDSLDIKASSSSCSAKPDATAVSLLSGESKQSDVKISFAVASLKAKLGSGLKIKSESTAADDSSIVDNKHDTGQSKLSKSSSGPSLLNSSCSAAETQNCSATTCSDRNDSINVNGSDNEKQAASDTDVDSNSSGNTVVAETVNCEQHEIMATDCPQKVSA